MQSISNHQNRFPLVGAHAMLSCDQCHKSAAVSQFQGLSTQCVACHVQDLATAQPDHRALKLSSSCETCHNMDTWMGARFNHAAATGFALTGMHATLACTDCHVNGNFQVTTTNCVGCHLKDFTGAQNPNHVQAGFSQDCAACHNTASWLNVTFNHNLTNFPLTGAHISLQCTQCHVNNNYNLTSTDCASCHMTDFRGTTNPNHGQAGMSTACQQCHNTTSWGNATFDHSTTGFPLTGAHTSVQCQQCHVNGNYNLSSANAACVSCHLKDFQGTTNPNHVQSGFSQACDQCHNTASWTNATFNHNTTGFPLTGAHTSLQCAQCHVNNNYNLTSADCVNCHLTDFQSTTSPNHVQAALPTACQQCHTTVSWGNATFDHSTTGFALTGAHTTVVCALCHVNSNYNLTSANTTCIACHQTDYSTTNNPPHAAANFATTCQQCHTTATWLSATFDHSTTGFALTGFHATLTCVQCHVNNNYALPANMACSSCHQADFTGTNNPAHVAAGFPTDCTICHTTTNWTTSTFNHATTGFALTGFHATMPCLQCHVANNYALTSANTLCYSCHQADFTGTNNPAHVAAGFPTDCSVCHTTVNWTGATFNHSTTPFPLTGAHLTVACTSCHINNVFAGTPTDCYSCHKTDYTGTTNPNHVAAGFPTTCATCHTTTAWTGATFNHTWFPVPHHTATLCGDCHTNTADYSVFTCTVCHTAAQTNPQHSGVKGYVWNSVNCYACHPRSNGG